MCEWCVNESSLWFSLSVNVSACLRHSSRVQLWCQYIWHAEVAVLSRVTLLDDLYIYSLHWIVNVMIKLLWKVFNRFRRVLIKFVVEEKWASIDYRQLRSVDVGSTPRCAADVTARQILELRIINRQFEADRLKWNSHVVQFVCCQQCMLIGKNWC